MKETLLCIAIGLLVVFVTFYALGIWKHLLCCKGWNTQTTCWKVCRYRKNRS
jgi:hypothetical protein